VNDAPTFIRDLAFVGASKSGQGSLTPASHELSRRVLAAHAAGEQEVCLDDAFVGEPFAGYGAFASMGGLFSSVHDLARWVDGFARAFAPRGQDAHPLSRASRLEMQQVQRMIDPELTWASVAALPTVVAMGYGFGTFVRSDMELGTVVAHSGGYPGFGSHMRWHPASGVGVVVLGNRTYFPALKIGDQMLRTLVRAEAAPIRRLTPRPRSRSRETRSSVSSRHGTTTWRRPRSR